MPNAENALGALPVVSVIMAFHNGEKYLEDAISSVLAQSLVNLELILSDDASSDGSLRLAGRAAQRDARVRVVTDETRGGPAQARNRALDLARGTWVAVVDADDLLHPLRFERLIAQAKALSVDMVADDLICFGGESGKSLLGALAMVRPWLPEAADLLRAETASPAVNVGYLKPMVRREALGSLRYRSYMTVGEDFDLLLRLRLAGARLAILPDAYYLYRRHSASTSHRLSEDAAQKMLMALNDLLAEGSGLSGTVARFLKQRQELLRLNVYFARLVTHLKSHAFGRALALLVQHPRLVRPLGRAAVQHFRRRLAKPIVQDTQPCLLLISENADTLSSRAFRRISVPDAASDWIASKAVSIAAIGTQGNAIVRAIGRPGLEASGYLPGWSMVELVEPSDGWTEEESRRIAAFPWPVQYIANEFASRSGGRPAGPVPRRPDRIDPNSVGTASGVSAVRFVGPRSGQEP